jgi:hypothetical protein
MGQPPVSPTPSSAAPVSCEPAVSAPASRLPSAEPSHAPCGPHAGRHEPGMDFVDQNFGRKKVGRNFFYPKFSDEFWFKTFVKICMYPTMMEKNLGFNGNYVGKKCLQP